MNKKILTGLIVFLVSFSVMRKWGFDGEKGFRSDGEGKYIMLALEEDGEVVFKYRS